MNPPLVYRVIFAAVLCLIVLGIAFPVVNNHPYPARVVESRNTIKQLIFALVAYRTSYGVLPTGDHIALIDALNGKNARNIHFIYLSSEQLDSGGRFLDPYGSPYIIDLSDPNHPKVHSPGKNKIDEPDDPHSDDICSWR